MKTAFELGFEKEAGGLGGAIIGAGIGAAGGAYAAGEGHRMSGAAIGGLGGGVLGAGIGAGAKRRVRPGGGKQLAPKGASFVPKDWALPLAQ